MTGGWPGSKSLEAGGVASQALPRKPQCSSPHFIPHLVVHGDTLPVLEVAAVGARSSRARPRRHRPHPKTRSPSLRPTAAHSLCSRGLSPGTSTDPRFSEMNFRPLCLRRTDSMVTLFPLHPVSPSPAPAPSPGRREGPCHSPTRALPCFFPSAWHIFQISQGHKRINYIEEESSMAVARDWGRRGQGAV